MQFSRSPVETHAMFAETAGFCRFARVRPHPINNQITRSDLTCVHVNLGIGATVPSMTATSEKEAVRR